MVGGRKRGRREGVRASSADRQTHGAVNFQGRPTEAGICAIVRGGM